MSDWTGAGSTTGLTEGLYCSHADILAQISPEVLIQLTDDANTGVADGTKVTQAIETADAEIDGYCAGRYNVPFSPVPPVIKGLAVEIAVYYLYKRRTIPERIETSYDKAVARLKDISKGIMSLGVAPPPPAAATGDGVGVNCSAENRVFTRETMKGF